MKRARIWVCLFALALGLAFSLTASAQVNTADLGGQVLDPQGLAVAGAKMTVKNLATGATRTAASDDTGRYSIVGLPPGRYELTVEAQGLAKLVNPEIVLTIGQSAEFDAHMKLQAGAETVTVTESTELIETRRTAVAETVDQRQIQNLPINGRNYINFTLLQSQATRDSAPSIGAAPTSGLNFGGQRARSNQVSVDGADAGDNSVNGIRATVSQEAVQEFQLIISNYMPEFGRATGGVVNIVTKGGSNEFHGNVFGYFRHKSLQARNPFSVETNSSGVLVPVKQAFTRVQTGVTLGGPIKRDKTFYFFSYETTRRQETGFSNIGANDFGLTPVAPPADVAAVVGGTPGLLTPGTNGQQGFVDNLALPVALRAPYFALVRAASAVALNGRKLPGAVFPSSGAPLPLSFVGLNDLRGNFPASEGTSLWSARLDHQWNTRNNSFVRASISPSTVTGIQVNGQNQNSGTNAGSRTSAQQTRDLAIVGQHVTSFSSTLFNEARFQFARRGLHYGFSQLIGGSNVGVDILGFASFGREPFSTVDRIERRYQWTDNLSWIKGKHTFKTGGDINLIQIRSNTDQIFQLDFGGIYRFGGLTASQASGGAIPNNVGPFAVPGLNAVQAYGHGIPGGFLQGIGNSNRPIDNKAFAFFVQDSWKIHPRLTLNYGVRYDIELTPLFTPATAINAAAEAALGVIEGIPHDKNNVAPRFALAWDPQGNGKTVVRAGYGLFYDHPLLASAFLAATADGGQSVQIQFAPGAPSAAPLTPLNAVSVLNSSSLFQGILNTVAFPSLGYQANGNLQRFDPFFPNSFFTNQRFLAPGTALPLIVLPFTFPVAANFVYGYAQQGNLTVERQLGHDYKFSVGYSYTHAVHLNRARNINTTRPDLLVANADIAVRAGLVPTGTNPLGVTVPSTGGSLAGCPPGSLAANTPGGGSLILNAPGILATAFALPNCGGVPLGPIGTAAVFNFFRPSGPNPTFAIFLPGGFPQLQGLAGAPGVGFPTGPAGIPVPYGDVLQQESSGNSVYHGLTVAVSKRFARHFQFLSSYTWSHSIDDSTDLQSPLAPQDNRNPRFERGNSTFDQRHRWVTSAVLESPYKHTDDGAWRKFLADFTIAPIFEVASGRPFNILTGTDANLDTSSITDRPSLVPVGTPGSVTSPFIPGVAFSVPIADRCANPKSTVPSPPFGCSGNLGRNAFVRPGFFQVDLRVSRKFYFTEKVNLEFITDMFNLLNRNNTADVSQLCDPGSVVCTAGQPTAALDPRQFQFALKVSW
jgi:hypothetical protein